MTTATASSPSITPAGVVAAMTWTPSSRGKRGNSAKSCTINALPSTTHVFPGVNGFALLRNYDVSNQWERDFDPWILEGSFTAAVGRVRPELPDGQ